MGTLLRIRVRAESRPAALALLEEALDEVTATESRISTWDPESDLSRLNRAPVGEWVELPGDVAGLLQEVWSLSGEVDGAFHPAVGPLIDAWDLRGAGRPPTEAELVTALEAVRAGVEIDARGSRARRLHAGAWIDAGAFGKGAALRRAAAVLRRGGADRAVLDFGGQILVMGPSGAPTRYGDAVVVGVAHPERRHEPVGRLRLRGGSVATSGLSERGGHVLAPATGRPVDPWGSVTVVGDDPVEVDVLSTALLVLGPDRGMCLVGPRPDVGVLFLVATKDGLRARSNRAMERWLEPIPGSAPTTMDPIKTIQSKETYPCDA